MNKSPLGKIQGAQRIRTYLEQEAAAAREGFCNYAEKLLSIPAFRAHPGWDELRDELLVAGQEVDTVRVNGQMFVRTDRRAPAAVSAIVRWFRRNRPQDAKRILKEESA